MSLEYYKIFHPDCLFLEGDNTIITSTDTGVEVRGKCEKDKEVKITWNAKDIINHSYVRYKEQTSLVGVEIEFEQVKGENIIDLSDTDNIHYLELHKGEETFKVPLGFLGEEDKFVHGVITTEGQTEIDLPHGWLKWDSLYITYAGEFTNGIFTEGTHFKVDYVKGKITLTEEGVLPTGTDIIINGKMHKNTKYIIKFDRINEGLHPQDKKAVDVKEIDKFTIPVKTNIDTDSIFSQKLENIKITLGDLWQIPTKLKSNGVKLGELYSSIKHINPKQIARNHQKLGYNETPTIYINDDSHMDVPKSDLMGSNFVLNNVFELYVSELFEMASKTKNREIDVVLSLKNTFMPKECYLCDVNNNQTSFLNPIHPLTIKYVKSVINQLDLINKYRIKVNYLIDGLYWQEYKGNLLVYSDYIIDRFEKEAIRTKYIKYKNLKGIDLNNLSVEDTIVVEWLSKALTEAVFEIIGSRASIGLAMDIRIFDKDNLMNLLNTYVEHLGSLLESSQITNNEWNKEFGGKDYIYKASIRTKLSDKNIGFFIKGLDDCTEEELDTFIENITGHIYDLISDGVENIILASADKIREKGHLLYKPMSYVDFAKMDIETDLLLCRANKTPIGYLTTALVTEITRTIDDIDSISFELPYHIHNRFSHNMEVNPLYKDVREERLILLNETDYFVIKQVDETDGEKLIKKVTAQSLEHKLAKSEVYIEQEALQLYSDSDDEVEDGIINILEKETGWTLGYMEESAKFEVVDGATTIKYRWFEAVNTDWYSFLTEEVSKSFGCIIQFNSLNKTINIYDSESIGINRGVYLSKDNYIISREKTGTTNDIVTRLRLLGKDEITVAGINPTGQTWLENYSYFIEMGDVSEELQNALAKYNDIVNEVSKEWEDLYKRYLNLTKDIPLKTNLVNSLKEVIKEMEQMRDSFLLQEDKENANKVDEELKEKTKELNTLEEELKSLEEDKKRVDERIEYINNQLDKSNTVDENNNLIFNPTLISELNEFAYYDTYSDNTITTPEQLMEKGAVILEERCRPLIEYTLDSTNFLKRIMTLRRKFNGELILGDIVILCDETNKTELPLYVVGFSYNPSANKLNINLSNKRSKKNDTKTLAKLLSEAKNLGKKVSTKQYLWNKNK